VLASPAPTDKALSVALPINLDAGPQADVQITLNSRTSVPRSFNVTPWLASVQPIRTALDPTHAVDLTLQMQGIGFTATPAAARFEGPGGTTTVTSFGAGGNDTQAKVTIPTGLANGVYNVRLVLGGPHNASNTRTLEVIPLVSTPVTLAVVVVSGKSVHRITVNGVRLKGSDVRLLIDGITFQAGVNANATQLVFTLGRLLDAGTHTISVNVDGHSSRSVTVGV